MQWNTRGLSTWSDFHSYLSIDIPSPSFSYHDHAVQKERRHESLEILQASGSRRTLLRNITKDFLLLDCNLQSRQVVIVPPRVQAPAHETCTLTIITIPNTETIDTPDLGTLDF